MTIYIDHQFHYESENLVRLFFPNDRITVVHEIPEEKSLPYIVSSIGTDRNETRISIALRTDSFFAASFCLRPFYVVTLRYQT